MRSLIDAALEAQAQRVIEAHPREFMGGFRSIAIPPCKNCGQPLRSHRRTGLSGYCHRTRRCATLAQTALRNADVTRRLPRKPCGLCGDPTISKTGFCSKTPCRARQQLEERERIRAIARGTLRPAAKIGARAQNGNP